MDWFSISTVIVDREDLSIYEKMCYVVLARQFQEDNMDAINMPQLAKWMGVEELVARGAFHALKTKGILIAEESDVRPGTIIKANQTDSNIISKDSNFHSIADSTDVNNVNKPMSYDQKILRVFQIIDEKINEKEARIILNFAGNDLKKVVEKYKIAKASQFQDKIEVLIHELQKKEKGRIIKKEAVDESVKSFETFEETEEDQKTQVNTYKINLMKKYAKK